MKPPTSIQAIIYVTAIIVLLESAIAYLLADTSYDLHAYPGFIPHAVMLTALSLPFIYLFIIRPYVVAHLHFIDKIEHLAHHDPLTNLPNRLLLSEYTEKIMSGLVRHSSYGALLYIDIDGFKIINDYHGYEAGDTILKEISRRLTSLIRGEDIAGRIGSNEFVVVLDQLSIFEEKARGRASMVSERIQDNLCQPIDVNNKILHIETSIGTCILTPEMTSVESAIKDADIDMLRTRRAQKTGATKS